MKPESLLAWAACTFALPAAAIFIRPDRDDSEYLELASHYASSVRLKEAGGEGVLIAPRWILTTAGSARRLRETHVKRVGVGGRDMEIVKLDIHDGLGLVGLKSDVKGIAYTPLFRGLTGEEGQAVVIAGHGETGRIGDRAPGASDGRRRASINTIEAVTTSTFRMRIKAAEEASDLQGALAPGDLGAAAYLKTTDGPTVAGIALSSDGTVETFARISAYRLWIDATMLKLADEEAEALLGEK